MPYPQRGGTGGGSRIPTLISNTDFADISALETFASNNPTLLLNNSDAFSTAFVAGDLYHYQGAEGVYVSGQWTDAMPEGLTPEMLEVLTSLISIPEGQVPAKAASGYEQSGMESGEDVFQTEKSIQTGLNSFFLDEAYAIQSSGRTLSIRNRATGDVFRLLVAGTSNQPSILVDRPDTTFLFESDDTGQITNPNYTGNIPVIDTDNPESSQYVRSLRMRIDPSSVLTNISIKIFIDGTLFQEETFPVITPSGVNNEYVFTFESPYDVLVGDLITGDFSSTDGDVILLGNTATGIPYQDVTLALSDVMTLAFADDMPHPVTLRRDMPSEEDAAALANASLNDNSALWIIANNQSTTLGPSDPPWNGNSNRSDAFINALQSGFLDADGNEIPTTSTPANNVRLRGGSTVRIFSANDYRVVNSPVFEGDITDNTRSDEDIRDVVAAMLTAGTNITLTEDDVNNTLTISSTGGGNPPLPGPDNLYYGLSSSNNPASVALNTLTNVDPTDPQTVSTGTTIAGQFFIILTPNTHDITTITDTVLQQDVTSIFTKTSDVRTESTVTYDSYVIGPLNAGANESYVLAFS